MKTFLPQEIATDITMFFFGIILVIIAWSLLLRFAEKKRVKISQGVIIYFGTASILFIASLLVVLSS